MNKKKVEAAVHRAQKKSRAVLWNSRLSSRERRDRRMTFGRYTGYFIRDVPDDYLIWAIKNIEDSALAGWFADEYHYRHPRFLKANK